MSDIRITELDFDQIKNNLKTFLQSKPEFNSYNFEASGLSVLLDVLAYNTHYDAFMANMLHNEAFLDSAKKRSSVVSRAKDLSYVPRSTTAASAYVDVIVNSPTGNPNYLTMDRYTQFNTSINGSNYTFVNTDSITIQPTSGVYRFSNVKLREGKPYSFSYNVGDNSSNIKYEIPNDNVDTSTLRITVQNSSTDSTTTVFTSVDDITKVGSTSNVYYIQENYNGKYEINFGDGILGKKLAVGNIIRIEYLICNATAANVSATLNQTFTLLSGTIGGNTNVTVSVLQNSTGGADRESIDEIKFNAPRSFIAQSRAVSADDYLESIQANVGNVESVAVWGGEDNDPPIYGKVFISLKPYLGYVISNSTKDSIKRNVLRSRNVVSVIPEFVDPEYIWVNLSIDVKYKSNETTKSANQIGDLVRTTVQNYFSTELQKFNKNFTMSKLGTLIDSSDPSINGNIIVIKAQKRIQPTLNSSQTFILNFGVKIHPRELTSTRFYTMVNNELLPARIADKQEGVTDYTGIGTLYMFNPDTNAIIHDNVGSVDYTNGLVTITSINVAGYFPDQQDIRITTDVQESSRDITVLRNNILILDDSTLNKLVNRDAGITINSIAEIV